MATQLRPGRDYYGVSTRGVQGLGYFLGSLGGSIGVLGLHGQLGAYRG